MTHRFCLRASRLTFAVFVLIGASSLAGCDAVNQDGGAYLMEAARDAATAQQQANCQPEDFDCEPPLGGGGGGGGTTAPPFTPPPRPFIFAQNLPGYIGGDPLTTYNCVQITHPFWGGGNDVTRGTLIYMSGIVVPRTKVNFGIYSQSGQLVKTHLTQDSRSNCVVHHEPEGLSTAGLAPGWYYIYASYNFLSTDTGLETNIGRTALVIGKYVGPLRVRS